MADDVRSESEQQGTALNDATLASRTIPARAHFVIGTIALGIMLLTNKAFGEANVPWITYEAEDMATTGTLLGPQYGPHLVASEASGRKCVRLNAVGDYVQFSAASAGNAIVVRYSVPDTPDGSGTNYTLSLYTNGTFAAKLSLMSRYSWLYGAYPFTN